MAASPCGASVLERLAPEDVERLARLREYRGVAWAFRFYQALKARESVGGPRALGRPAGRERRLSARRSVRFSMRCRFRPIDDGEWRGCASFHQHR